MPRPHRRLLDGVAVHVVKRGVARQPCFRGDEDRRFYLETLRQFATQFDCALHAYVLMTNHVHLLVTPQHGPALSELLRRLDQRYVQAFNRAYERSGTLWEGRFRSSLVDTDAYVLACYRYIELNPVRAGMTADASEFRWSSHRSNESGSPSGMLIAHPSYLALGVDVRSRGDAYRMLFAQPFPEDTLATIRKAIRGARILGRGQTPT